MSHRTNPDPTAEIRIGPKTYAETQGEKPFDWWAFLERAIAGKVERVRVAGRDAADLLNDGREHCLALLRAREWTTCACGQQCAVLPRHPSGEPVDGELMALGLNFVGDIGTGDWKMAKRTLRRIEARSAFLIATLLAPRQCTQPS